MRNLKGGEHRRIINSFFRHFAILYQDQGWYILLGQLHGGRAFLYSSFLYSRLFQLMGKSHGNDGHLKSASCQFLIFFSRYASTNFLGVRTSILRYPVTFNRCLSPLTTCLAPLAIAQARNLSSSGSSQI